MADELLDAPPADTAHLVPEVKRRRTLNASDAPEPSMAAHMESVILIEVTAVSANYLQPWKMHGQRQSSGSGFIISGRRIITNHHVVKDAIDVRLRKHGVARRWRGKVVVSAHDVDLAIVTVHEDEDDVFWDGVTPAEWEESLPTLQSSVHVVGFPMGGSTICVTQGVVSRIDCKNYRVGYTAAHNPGRILVIQIDAAINPGNSGGPAFSPSGKVVGVAFQTLGGDGIGYIIPVLVLRNFLDALEQTGGVYRGLPELPFKGFELRNQSLRRYLNVPPERTGVVIRSVAPAIADLMQEDDVIVAIDDKKVGDDFTVELRKCAPPPAHHAAVTRMPMPTPARRVACSLAPLLFPPPPTLTTPPSSPHPPTPPTPSQTPFRLPPSPLAPPTYRCSNRSELLAADYLVTCKRMGEPTRFSVLRNGQPREFSAVLGPLPHHMPRASGFDCVPTYVIIGGLVFVPLCCPMFDYKEHKHLSQQLYNLVSHSMTSTFCADPSLTRGPIVLINILADSLNYGYNGRAWRVLESLNGEKVTTMEQLCEMYTSNSSEFLRFAFSQEGDKIVLEARKCREIEASLMRTHAISSITSKNLSRYFEKGQGEAKAA